MKKMIPVTNALFTVLLLLLTSACAPLPSIVTKGELRQPSHSIPVVLTRDVEIVRGGTRSGLRSGTYSPEFEDRAGTFYRGVSGAVYSITKDGKHTVAEGGLWISRDAQNPSYWLYAYMGSLRPVAPDPSAPSPGVGHVAAGLTTNTTISTGASPGNAAAAGVVGVALVRYADSVTQGSVMKHSELPAKDVADALRATSERR